MRPQSKNLIPPEALASLQKAAEFAVAGKPADPAFVQQIAIEAEKIREEVKRKHGILDIGVSAIRELRDE